MNTLDPKYLEWVCERLNAGRIVVRAQIDRGSEAYTPNFDVHLLVRLMAPPDRVVFGEVLYSQSVSGTREVGMATSGDTPHVEYCEQVMLSSWTSQWCQKKEGLCIVNMSNHELPLGHYGVMRQLAEAKGFLEGMLSCGGFETEDQRGLLEVVTTCLDGVLREARRELLTEAFLL